MIPATRGLSIVCGLVICACTSAVSRTEPAVASRFYPEELAFIRADSELFEGVVKGSWRAAIKSIRTISTRRASDSDYRKELGRLCAACPKKWDNIVE